MSQKEHDQRVDYIEMACHDIATTKAFYEAVFGWTFTDWGDDYTSFEDGRLTGGFNTVDKVQQGSTLVIMYAFDLEATELRVKEAGGAIVKPTFPFPGGRRFHFTDPSGNELAVWTDQGLEDAPGA